MRSLNGALDGTNHRMRNLTRLIVVTTVLLGCVGCDQATKIAARAYLDGAPATSYFHDTLRLTYAENPGAFLSIGATLPKPARIAIFQGIAAAMTLALLAASLFWKRIGKLQVIALALLAASGLGNLIDRLLYDGRVTDFLNLGIGQLRTGIFNVADVVGVIGALLLLLKSADAPSNKSLQRAGER